MPASVIADIIYPFPLLNSSKWRDNYDPRVDIDYSAFLRRCNEIVGLVTFADEHWKEDHVQPSLDVVMAAVSIHVDQEVALSSGLFGLLGDQHIQIVDVDDQALLREFEVFCAEQTWNKDPSIRPFFKLIQSQWFQQRVINWKRNAELAILAQMWHMDQIEVKDAGDEPNFAWLPLLSEGEFRPMNPDEDYPKDDDPWVIRARKVIPKLRTRIMVRLCTNQCHRRQHHPAWRTFYIADNEKLFFRLEK
ncbi:hypothetical protein N7540_002149 [Penicillium herquei]|nr:hypothetical protein N7540_002149 [Penicillium herquei]